MSFIRNLLLKWQEAQRKRAEFQAPEHITEAELRERLTGEGTGVPEEEVINRLAEISDEELQSRQEQTDRFLNMRPEERAGVWHEVSSDCVARAMWEPNEDNALVGSLWLVFHGGDGKEYQYPEVPWEEWLKFMYSASKGKYVAFVIRPKYSLNPNIPAMRS